jgi:hypothetical protein
VLLSPVSRFNGLNTRMPIPDFNQHGLLPVGLHDCTLDEIQAKMTWSDRRAYLFNRLTQCINVELAPRFSLNLYVDGSFVTDKEDPDDTDIVLDLVGQDNATCWLGLMFYTDHGPRLKAEYDVHFLINLPGNNDFVQFFSYLGTKSAKIKGLDPKFTKGLLRVV